MYELKIKFEGIDYWNRPIFKSINGKDRYGSVNKLFNQNMREDAVLEEIVEDDLLYFGNSFGCEPMGDPAGNIKIVRPGWSLEKNDRIYIKSEVDGKMIAVTAIFTRVRKANEYLEIHPEEGMIYEFGGFVFIASNDDLGY